MLNDASGFRRIYLATGYTDLRRGMEGLASIIKFNFQLDPYQKDILFLFCGRRTDRIKGLVWEGDGFLLLCHIRKSFVHDTVDKLPKFLSCPEIHFFCLTLTHASGFCTGITFQIIISNRIIKNCTQLVIDCFQISG